MSAYRPHVGPRRSGLLLSLALLAAVLCQTEASAQTSSAIDGATPPGLATGAPAGSYGLSGFESVNPYSGNLNFHLPLVKLGGRGGAAATIGLSIDSVQWVTEKEQIRDDYCYEPGAGEPPPANNVWKCPGTVVQTIYTPGLGLQHVARPGYGPGVMSLRRGGMGGGNDGMFYGLTLTRLTFASSDGTQYELHDTLHGGQPIQTSVTNLDEPSRGKVFVASDGSGVTFVSDADVRDNNRKHRPTASYATGVLLLSDGTRYRIDAGVVTRITDRNGNYLSFAYDQHKRLVSAVDPLTRVVTVTYADLSTRFYDELSFKGFGGATRSIKVWRGHLRDALRSGSVQTYAALFPELNGGTNGHDPNDVARAVELPDGRSYTLRYNQYGELSRVVLPTGGSIEYDYTPGSGVVGTQIIRRVVERRDSATGATGAAMEHRQTFEATFSTSGPRETTVVVKEYGVGATPLAVSRRRFSGNPELSIQEAAMLASSSISYAPWREGKELLSEALDPALPESAPEAVLRRVENKWEQPLAGATWPLMASETSETARANDPQVTEVVTVAEPSGANLWAKQRFAYDRYVNRTDLWEYDYGVGSAPAHPSRRTHTDYLVTNVVGGITHDYVCDPATTCSNAAMSSGVGAGVIHQRRLPYAQQVYSVNPVTGAETPVAKSETRYDEAAYAPLDCGTAETPVSCSSASQWDDPGARPRGSATTARRWLDTNNTWPETRARFDRLGNARLSWDAKGNVSQVTYFDSFCNGTLCGTQGFAPNTFAFPTRTKTPKPDPAGTYGSASELTASTVYDFWTGLVYSSTDANNKTTRLEYNDPLDRPTAQVRPDGSRTDINYSSPTEQSIYVRTLTDLDAGRRAESYQFFDKMGRPARSFVNEGQSPNSFITADTEYDALGRAWRTSLPYRTGGSNDAVNPSGRWSETTFDVLGRAAETKTADGAKVTTGYSSNRVLATDQAGKRRISVTDALGRLTEVWEVTPNDPAKYPGVEAIPSTVTAGLTGAGHGYKTQYFYDALGNLRRVKQGAQQRFFAYDSLGRLLRAKNPEQDSFAATANFPALTDAASGVSNSQWSLGYLYDANGNLAGRIDARGVTAAYAYDALNRNTLVSYSDGTPGVKRIYDTAQNGLGRFHADWTWDGAGTYYTHRVVSRYDAVGRPLEQLQYVYTNNAAGSAFTTGLTYDKAGNVTSLTYPSGHKAEYRYDGAGRLGDHGGQPAFKGSLGDGVLRTYASQVVYDELGGMSQERYGTQTPVYNKRFYNSRGQLSEIRVSTHSIVNTDPNLRTNWNRGAIINHYSASGWGATGGGPDNNGNLLKQDVYIPNDDAAGGGHSLGTFFYEYDALNRLERAREGTGGADQWAQAYEYDRWGNRTVNAAGTWLGQPAAAANDLVNEKQFDKFDLANTNRLHGPGDAARPAEQRLMRYDKAGNLTFDGHTGEGARSYDAENRMTSAEFINGELRTAVHAYDADGRRVKRGMGAGAQVWQVYGVGGELLAEYAPNASPSTPRKEYGYRGGALLVTAQPAQTQGAAAAQSFVTGMSLGAQRADSPGWTGMKITTGAQPVTVSSLGRLCSAGNSLTHDLRLIRAGDNQTVASAAVAMGGCSEGQFRYAPLASPVTLAANTDYLVVSYEAGTDKFHDWTGTALTTTSVAAVKHGVYTTNGGQTWGPAGGVGNSYVPLDFQYQTGAGTTADVRWLVTDQLGTPRMVLDQTGSLSGVTRHDYLPFGEELFAGVGARATAQGYTADDNVRQQFTGYERDEETSLDYASARYYSPTQGRFTSLDPLLSSGRPGDPQTWNRYNYCGNNPLNRIDPSGLDWYYNSKGDKYRWFNEGPGEEGWEAVTGDRFVYHSVNGWVALDPYSSNWKDNYGSKEAAQGMFNQWWNAPPQNRELAGTLGGQWGPALKASSEYMFMYMSLFTGPTGEIGGLTSLGLKGGSAGARVASGMGGAAAEMTVVRTIERGESIADIVNEGKSLTFVSGNEHAVVALANGERALVSGGPGGINFAPGQITRIFGHSHPYGTGPVGASAADYAAIRALGQRSSWLFEAGAGSKPLGAQKFTIGP